MEGKDMSDKPGGKAPDRFNDGMIISIGGTVVADTEADVYGATSKVGQKHPNPEDRDDSRTDDTGDGRA
jgi:hypothetical protein